MTRFLYEYASHFGKKFSFLTNFDMNHRAGQRRAEALQEQEQGRGAGVWMPPGAPSL